MMISDQRKTREGKGKIWDRYQDMMLVGNDGQVVSFRRFKSLAMTVLISLIISLILVVILSVMLAGSRIKYSKLKTTLEETRLQLAELRDEKDLLLTQMVIKKKRLGGIEPVEPKKASPETVVQKTEAQKPDRTVTAPSPGLTAPKKAASSPPPKKVPVQLNADARNIKVNYQQERQVLSMSFRVYNTSKPKVALAGRSVVVFKNQDDPPIKWLTSPRVQLIDGKPSGKRGKAFKINNYRTLNFKAYQQKAPLRYNLATIYIYSAKGELLLSKDFSFKIDVKPLPKPVIPAPKPAQVKPKPKPAQVQPKPAPEQAQPKPEAVSQEPVPSPSPSTMPPQPKVEAESQKPDAGAPVTDDTVPPAPIPSTDQPTAPSSEQQLPVTEPSNDSGVQPANDASTTQGEITSPPKTQGEQP